MGAGGVVSGGGLMAVSYYLVAELGMLVVEREARDEAEYRSLLVSPESTLAVIDPNLEAISVGECVIAGGIGGMVRMEFCNRIGT